MIFTVTSTIAFSRSLRLQWMNRRSADEREKDASKCDMCDRVYTFSNPHCVPLRTIASSPHWADTALLLDFWRWIIVQPRIEPQGLGEFTFNRWSFKESNRKRSISWSDSVIQDGRILIARSNVADVSSVREKLGTKPKR